MSKNKIIMLVCMLLISTTMMGCSVEQQSLDQEKIFEEMEKSMSSLSEKREIIDSGYLIGGDTSIEDFYSQVDERAIAQEMIGTNYPNVGMINKSGEKVRLHDIEGPIVLAYSSGGCGACISSTEPMAQFAELHPNYNVVTLVGELSDINIDKLNGNDNDLFFALDRDDEALSYNDFVKNGYPFFIYIGEDRKVNLISRGSVTIDTLEYFSKNAFN